MDYTTLSIFVFIIAAPLGYGLILVPLYLAPKLGVRWTWNTTVVTVVLCVVGVAASIQSAIAHASVLETGAVPLASLIGGVFAGALMRMLWLIYHANRTSG